MSGNNKWGAMQRSNNLEQQGGTNHAKSSNTCGIKPKATQKKKKPYKLQTKTTNHTKQSKKN